MDNSVLSEIARELNDRIYEDHKAIYKGVGYYFGHNEIMKILNKYLELKTITIMKIKKEMYNDR